MKYRVSCIVEREELVGPLVTVLAAQGGQVIVEAERGHAAEPMSFDDHPPTRQLLRARRKAKKKPPIGDGAMIALQTLVEGGGIETIRTAFNAKGLPWQGVGPTLTGLRVRGFVRKLGKGEWEPTDKGREHAAKFRMARPVESSEMASA